MKTPLDAALLIAAWEGLRLTPYVDAAGVDTWGWGHARKGDEAVPAVLTRAAAVRTFMGDLAIAERAVDKLVAGVALEPHQYGALVAFTFNLGAGALAGSTLLKRVREGDFVAAGAEFGHWIYVHVNGRPVPMPGLVERRKDEAALWVGTL